MSARIGYEAAAPIEPRRLWSVPGLFDHVVAFLTVTLLGWMLSIVLEWCGIAFGWWDQPGAGHSARLLRTELSWLDRDFTTPLAAGRLIEWADWGARQLYHWSGLQGFVRWVVSDPPAPWVGLETIRQGLRLWGEYLLAACYITQLIGARLVVVLLTLPAYAMIGVMSLVDGLVQRDLSRFGGGLEPVNQRGFAQVNDLVQFGYQPLPGFDHLVGDDRPVPFSTGQGGFAYPP